MFTVREFNRIGLDRLAEKDFRDDGTSFRCWGFKDLVISYTKSGDRHYISVNVDYSKFDFTPNDVMEEKWCDLRDEFNGCENPDADKLLGNLVIIERGLKDLQKRVERENLDVKVLYDQFNKEVTEAREVMDQFHNNYDWIHSNMHERNRLVNNYVDLEEYLNTTAPNYDKEEKRHIRDLFRILKDYGFVDQSIHFYVTHLRDALNK